MKSGKPLGPRPKPLPASETWLSFGIRAPLFLIATAFYGSLSMIASCFEKDGRWQHRIAQQWARAGMAISGAKLTVLNPERLTGQPAVYVCNHLSYMDTPAIFSALPFQFRIIARHDLWKMPFIGWWLNRSGQVGVDLSDPRASVASLISAVKTLKTGMPLFIFPEGGRTATGYLAPFMKGPAFMAIKAQLPLIPMALIGTWELLPIHSSAFHPVPVTLAVGEPIDTTGMTMKQSDALTTTLHQRIEELYYEHSWLKRPEQSPGPPSAVPVELASSTEPLTAAPNVSSDLSQEAGKR